ncbi:hypothetical protein Q1695_000271 [Nippostrongylus brasiliensis]|nr:hypothetical protein Q1695_000271 [Nippostrongylus brasiliensis]
MTSQVCVIMDAPASVRTRLISPTPPFSTESNDYFFIYVSLIVTVTMLLSSAFLVWRWGLHGLGTHLSVVLAMVLLAFNAYLGARTWADLRRQHREYLKHRLGVEGVGTIPVLQILACRLSKLVLLLRFPYLLVFLDDKGDMQIGVSSGKMLMDVESILDERVDQYDLERFREAYETQLKRGSPSAIATFNYGTALIRSTKSDVIEGSGLLEKLLREEPDDINKRDYVYFLAIANARLRNYDRALAYIDILLAAETHNRQASQLRDIIEKRMKKDGLFGLAVIGGGALVLTGIVAALFAAKK